jgi:hypothetical protein
LNRKEISQRIKDKKVKTYFDLEKKEWRTFFPVHYEASIKACKEQGYECDEVCTHFIGNGCDRPATTKEINRQLHAINQYVKEFENAH